MTGIKVCPMPGYWAATHEKLLRHHEASGGTPEDEPPMALVFEGWWGTSDTEKHERWVEMQQWAENHGCLALTQELPEEAWYCVTEMSDDNADVFDWGRWD